MMSPRQIFRALFPFSSKIGEVSAMSEAKWSAASLYLWILEGEQWRRGPWEMALLQEGATVFLFEFQLIACFVEALNGLVFSCCLFFRLSSART